ncbi:MAG: MFS transporter [Desulfuromonadales bacterium]|nr:MFS transporter [Desulfuromonadales bacterium]
MPGWTTLLRVFFPFAFGYFLSYLYRTVTAVIAPDLVADLDLEPASLGLLTATYFLAFAAFQLPLGLLLDRFGARRVEATLLLFAAAGALVFARAESLTGLMLGRALIGLGVSACLMAAFKAFSVWFPVDRLPLANSVQMVSGGLGALAASTPVELAMHVTDWRGLFLLLAGLTLLAAVTILLVVPEKKGQHGQSEPLRAQLGGLAAVFTSREFVRLAPWAVTAQAAYLSLPGLWAGPWLRDVAGLPRLPLANTLLLVALAMTCGYLFFGALADRLRRRAVRPLTVATGGMLLFMTVQLLLIFAAPLPALLLWPLFGFCGSACILPYAVLSQTFPRQLTGRANTALNLLVFLGAFAAQWTVGVVIGCWPLTAAGGYHPTGYQAAFGLLLGLQVLGAVWFLAGRRHHCAGHECAS